MKEEIKALHESMQKTYEWLNELRELGHFQSKEQAYSVLRLVLHKLRDSLSIDLAAHLGAQLPLVIAGIYYSGWHPAISPSHERSRWKFLNSIDEELKKFSNSIAAEQAIKAVYGLLERKLSPGLIEKIKQSFPQTLQNLWLQPEEEIV